MIKINKKLLEQLYTKEGKSTVEISKMLDFSIDTIWRRLKLYNLNIRHQGSKGNEIKIKKEELYRLYVEQLKSQKEISKIYKCSSTTIRNYLIKFGYKSYIDGYRPKFSIRGDNHPTKRPEVREK